tara:strand:+ start:1519 stop:3204 length:1686 start_codon:yes stop_codon:yes gene_type:complete
MVELPRGNIIEERRGGAGILATLVNEMIKLNSNGYIRSERTPSEQMPRVGQVVVSNGEVSAAIHEAKAILEGVDALIEIEADCLELDCTIQLIEDVDVHRILDLHPTAKLAVEAPEESKSSKWWQNISNRTNAWTRASKLPTIEASIEAPEFVKAKAAAMVHRHVEGGVSLKPGCVYSNESESLFKLASNLKIHGKPLLVISRKTREELSVKFNIPAENCLWLSQKESEGVQFVDIDAIKGTVYGFLEGNLRAVLLLDGLEYLANVCGAKSVIEMVRELGDRMRFEDDCLLISCDKSAWSKSDSAQLMRAAPYLESEVISAWNNDPDALLDHPLMAPPTEEELLRLAEYLEANTPESFAPEEIVEITPETEPIIEEIPIEVVEEEIIITETEQEEVVEDEPEVESPPKGPRKPQRVKRRKSKHVNMMSDRDARLAGLAAVKGDKEIGEMPSNDLLPKTAIGKGKEGSLPMIPNTIPTELGDVVRQDSAKKTHALPRTKLGPKTVTKKKSGSHKNVISPLAARGVEVKRNVSKRSQASSVPQKEIDIDKELESWKFDEEELE